MKVGKEENKGGVKRERGESEMAIRWQSNEKNNSPNAVAGERGVYCIYETIYERERRLVWGD